MRASEGRGGGVKLMAQRIHRHTFAELSVIAELMALHDALLEVAASLEPRVLGGARRAGLVREAIKGAAGSLMDRAREIAGGADLFPISEAHMDILRNPGGSGGTDPA